jgi:hypothetical protein
VITWFSPLTVIENVLSSFLVTLTVETEVPRGMLRVGGTTY